MVSGKTLRGWRILAWARFLIVLLLALSATSCNQSGSKPRVPAALPTGWPVAELRIPPNSFRAVYRKDQSGNPIYVVDGDTHYKSSEEPMWLVSFTNDSNHNEVLDKTVAELSEEGWRVVNSQNPNGDPDKVEAYYLEKPGSIYHIELVYLGFRKRGLFEYCIFQFHGT